MHAIDSGFKSFVGFRIFLAEFWIPKRKIPDATSNDSGSPYMGRSKLPLPYVTILPLVGSKVNANLGEGSWGGQLPRNLNWSLFSKHAYQKKISEFSHFHCKLFPGGFFGMTNSSSSSMYNESFSSVVYQYTA